MNPIKEVVLALLVGMVVLGCTWLAGANHNEQKWLAKQATVERAAHSKYEAEVVRSDKAVGAFVADYQAMQSDFQTLTEKFNAFRKRGPIVVAGGAAFCPVDHGSTPAPDPVNSDDLAGPLLTAGAVWMWNSALTGKDQPANTCGAVDPTAPACAVATSITLDDAWDNHATNAQICAEDRLFHQRLIDLLKQREGIAP